MHPRVQELLSREYDEQRSDGWFNLRKNLLTASDVASAIDANFFKKPFELLKEKVGQKTFMGNANTERGTRLEPLVRDFYDSLMGSKTHEIGLVVHDEHQWLGGSVDGITEDGLMIEIKCPNKLCTSIPSYYIPQVQVLMEITQLEECDFVQYSDGVLRVLRVPRDREWFRENLPKMKEFWDSVQRARKFGLCEITSLPSPRAPASEVVAELHRPAAVKRTPVPGKKYQDYQCCLGC